MIGFFVTGRGSCAFDVRTLSFMEEQGEAFERG